MARSIAPLLSSSAPILKFKKDGLSNYERSERLPKVTLKVARGDARQFMLRDLAGK